MSDYERAQARSAQGPLVREACFVALREAGSPLSALEVRDIIEPTVGEEVERRGVVYRWLSYGDVFAALRRLERDGAVVSQKIHTSRIWWSRG